MGKSENKKENEVNMEKERQRDIKKPCTKCGVCITEYTYTDRNGGCHSFNDDDDDDDDSVEKIKDIVRTRTNSNIIICTEKFFTTFESLSCLSVF